MELKTTASLGDGGGGCLPSFATGLPLVLYSNSPELNKNCGSGWVRHSSVTPTEIRDEDNRIGPQALVTLSFTISATVRDLLNHLISNDGDCG